ncbi:TlpA disulfide reductase family protein [Leucobacter sp. W1478]|uniref:TlpA disulfide reductase family protein n=1 Tax=Leucobacter sp. W1478 TaxID=3439065 RepID=UPI003F3A30C0
MTAPRTAQASRAIVVSIVALLTLASCSSSGPSDSLDQQWQDASDQGYISGDGSTTSIPQKDRTGSVEFEGVTEWGESVTQADFTGSVTVVNFWYAGCPPCRAEAPDLVSAYEEFVDQGVQFLGVNTRDGKAQAVAFAEEFGIEYSSILDTLGDRAVQRAFAAHTPLNAVPTTLVLDAEGRVAHRVIGQIAGVSQMRALITETLAEGTRDTSGESQ